MQTSSNYGLKLPEGTDNVKRQDFVDNFTKIDSTMKSIDNKHSAYGTTSGTNTYTVSITGVTSLYDGLKVTVKIGTSSTGASTLNINGLGAKTILDSLGNAITSGGLKAGLPYQLCYNGTNFIVLGKGGGGNATADKILSGYKATVDSGQVTGTMANNGAINATLNAGQSKAIPAGYTSGGTITANSLASQTQATAGAGHILSGQTAWVNGSKITGNIPNRGFGGGNGGGANWWQPDTVVVSGDRLHYRPTLNGAGTIAYTGDCWLSAAFSSVANALGITANKIVSGNNICGVNGSAESRKMTAGSLSVKGSLNISINIGFSPNMVILFSDTPISDGSLWLYGFMYNGAWKSIFSKDNQLSSWNGTITPNNSGFSVSGVTANTSSYASTITYICA